MEATKYVCVAPNSYGVAETLEGALALCRQEMSWSSIDDRWDAVPVQVSKVSEDYEFFRETGHLKASTLEEMPTLAIARPAKDLPDADDVETEVEVIPHDKGVDLEFTTGAENFRLTLSAPTAYALLSGPATYNVLDVIRDAR